MNTKSWGNLLLVFGALMLALFTFAFDLPQGLDFGANFVLGIVPVATGLALLWWNWRSRRADQANSGIGAIRDQIIWRAVALGGSITSAEAAAHCGLPEPMVEHVLMSLVSEGRADAEPGDGGGIVYRIESPVAGTS